MLVVTVRALKHHGGVEYDPNSEPGEDAAAIEAGLANLARHLGIVREFGLPCVVAVNRRPGDSDEELELVRRRALELGAFGAEVNEGFERGGAGATALAEASVAACEQPSDFGFMYEGEDSIEAKIRAVATRVYGAGDIALAPAALQRINEFEAAGLRRAADLHGQDSAVALGRSRPAWAHPRASPSTSATSAPTREQAGWSPLR